MAPEAEGAYDVPAVRCHACSAHAKAANQWAEGNGDTDGIYFGVRRADPTA
jgi:hypothetical protein